MSNEYSEDYLSRLRDAVERFEAAFEAWMATQVESSHMESRGLFPTVWAKEGQDADAVRRLELDVAGPLAWLRGPLPSPGPTSRLPGSE